MTLYSRLLIIIALAEPMREEEPPTAMSARRFLTTVSVWSVICIILPCNQEYILYGRATVPLRPHDPPSSYERVRAPYRDSFPFQSQRVLSLSILVPATPVLSISLRIATSLIRSLAGLTRGAVSAYVGHAASLGRPPPTRSGPCRCCATGTGRAVRRSRAIRARSPRPWGSSRGC